MLTIDLNIDSINRINSDIKSTDSALKKYNNDLDMVLTEIENNIRSSYINGLLKGISYEARTVCNNVYNHLGSVTNFLDKQISSYEEANEIAKKNLMQALSNMDNIVNYYTSRDVR